MWTEGHCEPGKGPRTNRARLDLLKWQKGWGKCRSNCKVCCGLANNSSKLRSQKRRI
jgi:hypothetical protein